MGHAHHLHSGGEGGGDARHRVLDREALGGEEAARLQAQQVETARVAIDEVARLGKESLTWASELATSWRRMAVETTRRATDLFTQVR